MNTSPLERVERFVQEFDPAIVPLLYPEPMKTSEAAATALGVEIGQIAKSILFRSGDEYAMFVAAGDVRIHAKQVKAAFHGAKAKMATPEEVEAVTGFQVGAVCPFALLREVPIYVDSSLQRFPLVYTAAGLAESLLPVSYEQLLQMTNGRVIDAASDQ
ncbi:YbaK/EbsC family protein [Brevibacillus choshinensis]|uniref:YbaK/EbsC family protein n=1 Tax=Brevibacillus choshinensis TaxID=54911 RepID=A0ABX7FQN4_BRECH|nr:YbaK/EbsC family protein [Brevibacillus choshinensis]QRG68411.1 YbaK/EbsC family protein [Brevibacillus choshinensis]